MNPPSEEIAYLKSLMEDFPAGVPPEDARKAFQKIATRYAAIEQSYQRFTKPYIRQNLKHDSLAAGLKQLVFVLHEYLFVGILSNTGQTRKTADPKDGRIGFGGIRHQQHQPEFHGTAPSKIDGELDKALAHLVYEPEDPVENAMRFYQHFVYIHPFYDGNGRIGRVLVSIYLHLFACYVKWEEFDGPNNSRFINKLNACHKRMESRYTFERYFGYLLDFFRKFVIPLDELSDFK